MQELPRFIKCFILFLKDALIKLSCISMFSFKNSTGYEELANIPPTFPAALIISVFSF